MPRGHSTAVAAKDLVAARIAINKKYGTGTVISLSEMEKMTVEVISTGALLLDHALGVGGFPCGRLIELYGPPSAGKSTLSLSAARATQAKGLAVLYLDFEHAFDGRYATALGVDLSDRKFALSQPESLEQGFQVAEEYVEQGLVGLIIVDSVAAMATTKELEGEIGDNQIALIARAMSQVLRRFTAKVDRSNVAVLFINHVRDVIGGMPGRVGMIRKTTPGGTALKFYSSVRIELAPLESIKGKVRDPVTGKMLDGNVALKVKATVVKNKLAPPYRTGTFYLRELRGVSEIHTVLEIAIARQLIRQNGSRYLLPFKDELSQKPLNLGGMESVIHYLEERPDRYAKLRDRVLQFVGQEGPALLPTDDVAEPEPDESFPDASLLSDSDVDNDAARLVVVDEDVALPLAAVSLVPLESS